MIDMTTGKPWKLILQFSLPLLAGNVLQQTYNIVDSIVVGNFVGKEALAAVGNSFIIIFLINSFFMGIGMGATILISQFFGAVRHDKIRSSVSTMYIAMTAGSVIVSAAGILLTGPLLSILNTPAGLTYEYSRIYLITIFAGSIFSFGFNINAAFMQGIGDSMSSLIFLASATVLNIILDFIFVIPLGMGVFGVALATVLSQGASFLLGLIYIRKKIPLLHVKRREMLFDKDIFIKSMKTGLPVGAQNIIFCFGTIVLQRLVNSYGPGFMAGYSITGKIDSFAFMPIASFSNAVTTYVGQNLGAGRIDRIKAGVKTTNIMSGGLCIVISALVLVCARFLLSAFTRDPEVIDAGLAFLYRLMPFYFLLSIVFITNGALRGTGSTVIPLTATIVSLLVCRVPSAYLFDHFFGRNEMFWCFAVGWAAGICISVPAYLSGKWKKKAESYIKTAA